MFGRDCGDCSNSKKFPRIFLKKLLTSEKKDDILLKLSLEKAKTESAVSQVKKSAKRLAINEQNAEEIAEHNTSTE